jgi:hypothetical protein
MAEWSIKPTWKKSIIERIHYTKGKKKIVVETGWRWGEFTCETDTDEKPLIEAGDDLYDTQYNVELVECDDGCWTEYEFTNFTEKQEEKMREWLEENSSFDLEETGWVSTDTEMIIDCDPEIIRIDE